MKILISGVDRTSMYSPKTLRISDKVNQRGTLSFNLIDKTASGYRPPSGAPVEIYDNANNLVFGGFVQNPQSNLIMGTSASTIPVNCTDNQSITDRKLVIESYDGWTAGAIVNDLISKYLAVEGISAGHIQDGPIVTRAVFPYIQATQAMNDLAQLAGYSWQINADKTLDFGDGTTNIAPWNVTSTSPIRNVSVKRNTDKYRNRQYIRGGMDTTAVQTQKFAGDGQNQTFTVAYPLAATPTLSINGTAVPASDVGIQGVDQNKQWYWNKNSQTISQDASQAPLKGATSTTPADVLSVQYQGYYPIIVVVDAGGAIQNQKTVEGSTTGIWENVVTDSSLDTTTAAQNKANAMLQQYASVASEVQFDTDTAGLGVGQIITIDLPQEGLSSTQCLIDQVTIVDYTATGDLRYTVHCVDGQARGHWSSFFTNMSQQSTSQGIRENEVIVKIKSANDNIKVTDSLSISRMAPESRVGYAKIGVDAEVG